MLSECTVSHCDGTQETSVIIIWTGLYFGELRKKWISRGHIVLFQAHTCVLGCYDNLCVGALIIKNTSLTIVVFWSCAVAPFSQRQTVRLCSTFNC